ncbi:MAG: hypothetical protein Q7J29_10260 [Stagnimonas sp.]|nr:hypothetical protein [Stagnimonas sp.]
MKDLVTMRFESELQASAEEVWTWMTSIHGISLEMSPYLRMTVPQGFLTLADAKFQPGRRLFRSWLKLFGVLPIDYSDLTLLTLDPGVGFIEQSPMGSMRLWRHERRIESKPGEPARVMLIDQLTFSPRLARPLVAWLVRYFFAHRHRVLRRTFSTGDGTGPNSGRKC